MSRDIFLCVVLSFSLQASPTRRDARLGGLKQSSAVAAQKAEGSSARPVRTTPVSAAEAEGATRQVDLLRFDFQEIYLGYEGPNYTRIKGEPPTGMQLIAEAQLFKPEVVTTAKFELVDARGRVLQPLFFTKKDTDVMNGDFVGVVTVPTEPFRVRVSGVDVTGKAYRRVYGRLFRPATRRPAPSRIPLNLRPDQAELVRRRLEVQDQQTKSLLAEEGRKSPGGTINLPQIEVSGVTYEPLVSEQGNTLGMRVRYAVRVSQDGYYRLSPAVSPIYADVNLRGKIQMQIMAGSVEPLPDGVSADGNTDFLRYGGGARYKAGTTYRFVADIVPNFAIQNAQRTRFCIMRWAFNGSPAAQAWREMLTSDVPVTYDISIEQTTFRGRTEGFYAPGVFYRSLRKEGAKECSEGGNINF